MDSFDSGLIQLSMPWKGIRIKEIWIGNDLNVQVWTRLLHRTSDSFRPVNFFKAQLKLYNRSNCVLDLTRAIKPLLLLRQAIQFHKYGSPFFPKQITTDIFSCYVIKFMIILFNKICHFMLDFD